MIRRSTVVYIILLLVLAGAYYYLNNREQTADIELTVEPAGTDAAEVYLFTPEEGTPSGIRIESKSGDTVEIARGGEGAWELREPVEAAADQGAAEAAATQITTMRILDTVPDIDPEIVGLEVPEAVLTVKFTSGEERTVDIGVVTPTESGYYIRDTEGNVAIVSKSAIDSLLGILIAPPYLETPTPAPETGTATDATVTPGP